MNNTIIRLYEERDRETVRRIGCETAFFGYDRALFLNDDELLSDALTLYFTDREPQSCFVAEKEGKVIGYVIGSTSSRVLNKTMGIQIIPGLLWKGLLKGTYFKGRALNFLTHLVLSMARGEFRTPDFSKNYPATLHINIEKSARGHGLGTRLINRYIDFLKEKGVRGVHFGVMSEGAKTFFTKNGFELLYETKRSYLKYRTKKTNSFYVFGKNWEKADV